MSGKIAPIPNKNTSESKLRNKKCVTETKPHAYKGRIFPLLYLSRNMVLQKLKDIFIPVPPLVEYVGNVETISGDMAGNSHSDKKSTNEVTAVDLEDDGASMTSSKLEQGHVHRKLKNRHIQLIGIGGTIGVGLFVSIGNGLKKGGPLSLLLGIFLWCLPVLAVTATTAEMVCYLPIPSPFITLAGRCVDEAYGVMTGFNFWVLESSLIPFELTLFNQLLHFWFQDYSAAIPLVLQMVAYFLINIFAVRWYGETEFWCAIGKVILAVGLMCFTFFTMVGANPLRDVYGFRNWNNPGPMNEYYSVGDLGRFQGFLSCVIIANFLIAGPEYVSMVAGETINPRKTLPRAFKQVAIRLTLFFVGGALCVGIVVSSRDPLFLQAIAEGRLGAGSSPYVIAMYNLKIKVLPHIVNVLLLTSSFSAGNSYTYCSSRSLYGLARTGMAPKFFSYCNKDGVPIYSVLMALAWALLGFLQLGKNSSTVLDWIINLVSASQLTNFFLLTVTYNFFRRACIAQGVDRNDRNKFSFIGWCQPYLSIVTGFFMFSFMWIQGYTVFLPGNWSIETFLFNYFIIFLDIAVFIGYKVIKRTKLVKPENADITTGLAEVEEHERMYYLSLESQPEKDKTLLEKCAVVIFGD